MSVDELIQACAKLADDEAERWLKHLRANRQSASVRMASAARVITARKIADEIRKLTSESKEQPHE